MHIQVHMSTTLMDYIERVNEINRETSEPESVSDRAMMKIIEAMKDSKKHIALRTDDVGPTSIM